MKKRLAAIMTGIVLVAAAVTGCGSSKDATAYVKGVMDIAYNQGTEDYVKTAGVQEADAKKYMKQSVEAEAKIMAAYFGIEEPSEKVVEAFVPVVEKMYEGLDYELKADGDKVTVTCNQVVITLSENAQKYMEEFNVKRYVDGDTACTDDVFAKEMAAVLLEEAGDFCGTEKEKVQLTVQEKDGKFIISDDDLVRLDASMVVYP